MEGQVPPSSPQSHSSATPAPPAAPPPPPPPPPPPASDSPPNHTTTPTPTPAPTSTTTAAASITQTGASPAPPPLASIIKTESGVVPPVVLSDHHQHAQQQQQQAPMMMLIHNNSSSSNAATPIISGASPVAMNSNNSLLGVAGAGPLKRKRGRPRKYVEGHHHHHHLHNQPVLIVGSSPSTPTPVMSGLSAISGLPTTATASHAGMALALAPLAASSPHAHLPFAAAAAAAGILSAASPSAGGGGGGAAQSPGGEKKRGRPPGSGKKQQLAALGAWLAGSAGQGFTPHVITVGAGEDVATKIISFSQIGPRATCVLSANGAISNVTLRQPATSGGTVTYEGRFEILSLSGSFLLTENGNTRSRTGGLSVSLAGPDGRVIGGSVAGLLIAATPVQVVVGSFISETRKPVPVQVRPNSGSSNEMLGAAGGVTSPMSISRPVGSSPLNDNSINTNSANTNSSSQVTWSGNQQEDHQQQQQLQNQNQNAGHGTDINILPTA